MVAPDVVVRSPSTVRPPSAWRGRRRFLGLALGVTVAVVLTLVVVRGGARRTEVGPNLIVNPAGGVHLLDENNSPSVAVNPRDSANVVEVNRLDRPRFSARLSWSADGGRSWQPNDLPLPAGRDRPYAPDVAFAPDGTLYVSYVNLVGAGNVPDALWISRSSDGGRSLSPPVQVAGPLSFQARLAVDGRGTVHLTWLKANQVGLLTLVGPPSPVVASSSTDGARTFSAPVAVSDAGRSRVGAASPVIDSSGDLVVLYEDWKDDRRDFENLEGPPWDKPFSLVVSRSSDGGRSFSPGVEIESGVVPTRRFLAFLPEFPSIAAGPHRSLYVSWADGRNGDLDVFLRRSPDGAGWSAPVRVNSNPLGDGTSQYLPRVGVAPGGRVDVAFLDRRADPANLANHTHLATSSDQGRSFRDLQVSSGPSDSRIGPTPNDTAEPLEADLGSRLGLASGKGGTLVVWTDTRDGNQDTGRQDIFVARVSRPGSPSK